MPDEIEITIPDVRESIECTDQVASELHEIGSNLQLGNERQSVLLDRVEECQKSLAVLSTQTQTENPATAQILLQLTEIRMELASVRGSMADMIASNRARNSSQHQDPPIPEADPALQREEPLTVAPGEQEPPVPSRPKRRVRIL